MHEKYMKKAFLLAKKGIGKTNPNPLVGAVIVKNDKIIGQGYHKYYGGKHAEINAIEQAGELTKDSTLYINLEPCSHWGKTPPCVERIIKAKIKQVIIAMKDPNPKVNGQGIEILKKAGIKIQTGILENKAKELNEIFINFITKKKPFVILKTAMSLDGKIATCQNNSKWITGKKAREKVHKIRNQVSSLMIGVNTVIIDNPSLTTRLNNKFESDPIRIIVDSQGRIPLESKILNQKSNSYTIIATTEKMSQNKEKQLKDKGAKIIRVKTKKTDLQKIIIKEFQKIQSETNSSETQDLFLSKNLNNLNIKVDLSALMKKLYQLQIDSILLEGGGTLNFSALESEIVDKIMFFIAPKIIGGSNSPTSIDGIGFNTIQESLNIKNIVYRKFGDDLLIEGYV